MKRLNWLLLLALVGCATLQSGTKPVAWRVYGEPGNLVERIEQAGGEVLEILPEGAVLSSIPFGDFDAVYRTAEELDSYKALGVVEEEPSREKVLVENAEQLEQVSEIPVEKLARLRTGMVGDRAKAIVQSLPTKCDNSVSRYFPPIRSQGGQNSCVAWAWSYYYLTYTQAMDEDLDASLLVNQCSPAFTYSMINGGADYGASVTSGGQSIREIGACSWNLMPYGTRLTTWPDALDFLDAIKRRVLSLKVIGGYGCTEEQLLAIKQHLANGHIAVTNTQVMSNWRNNYPRNASGINNQVLFANAGSSVGGHAMTLVGYDDEKAYVANGVAKQGAFLVANSWGSGWGSYNSAQTSKGFIWVGYDYWKANNGGFGVAYFCEDRPDYRPTQYALATVQSAKRGTLTLSGGGIAVVQRPLTRDGGYNLAVKQAVAVDLSDAVGTPWVELNVVGVNSVSAIFGPVSIWSDFNLDGVYEQIFNGVEQKVVGIGQTVRY